MRQFVAQLGALVTVLGRIAAVLERIATLMPTLTDAVTGLKTAVVDVVSDETTKNATIADLTAQLATSKSDLAAAQANAASPDVINDIIAQSTALEAALHAVSNTPAPVTTPPATGG